MVAPFLYEQSVVHRGYLIIPYQHSQVAETAIYSYGLLAAIGHQSQFHQVKNPAGLYADHIEDLLTIAREHLDQCSDQAAPLGYFQQRYVYQGNLVIISAIAGKYFYDHYPPDQLRNIAAPRLFASEQDCIAWVKQGLDRHHPKSATRM